MAVIAVLNNNDAGPGSLRAAIELAAPSGDTIDLSGIAGTITLGANELTIDQNLEIVGPGEGKLTITSNLATHGLIHVSSGASLTMSDVTLADGYAWDGGSGGITSAGNLSLRRVTFRDCTASHRGGAIFHSSGGALTLTDCSFINNSVQFGSNGAAAWGGAVFVNGGTTTITGCLFDSNTVNTEPQDLFSRLAYGGAIALLSGCSASITNCSFASNKARGDHNGLQTVAWGGAIYADATSAAQIVHCTFDRNLAVGVTSPIGAEALLDGAGGAIFAVTLDSVSVANCIFSGNDSGTSGREANRSVKSLGGNILQYASPFRSLASDQINTFVPLSAPMALGGPTRTIRPHFDTKVRDKGVLLGGVPATDQRGAARTPKPDPGAYEFQGPIVAGYGNGLRFSGDDTVVLPRITQLESQPADFQNYTVQAWVRLLPAATGVNTIFYYGDPATQGAFVLAYDADAQQLLFRAGSASTTVSVPVAKTTMTDWWVHVAGTYSQTQGDATAVLYLNGNAIGQASGTGRTTYAPAAQVTIASWGDQFQTFTGSINDVRLSAAVLPTNELGGWFLPSAADPALVGHWRFDENTGIQVRDSSGYARHGMLYGTTVDAARVDTADTMRLAVMEDGQTSGLLPAYDANGGTLLYELVEAPQYGDVIIDPSTGLSVYTPFPDADQDDRFTYRVYSAASGWSDPDEVSVDITPVADAPVFTSTPVTTATSGSLYAYDLTVSDPDSGDALDFSFVTHPAWLGFSYFLDASGNVIVNLRGTPSNAYAGDNTVIVRVNDGTHIVDQAFTIIVTPINHAPGFTSTAPNVADGSWEATADSRWTYHVTFNDPDGDPLTIAAYTMPAWLTLIDHGDGTATLSGTPTNFDVAVGDGIVDLRVTDGHTTTSQAFRVIITPVNHLPVFTTTAPTAATKNVAYAYAIVAADADSPPFQTLTITAPTKPAWLTLTDNGNGTAMLAGRPTTPGSYDVTLRVSDGFAATDQSFTIVVPQPNRAPVFDPIYLLPTATSESPYSAMITATDADGDPITFTVSGVHGFYTVTDDGAGHLIVTGTPTNADAGQHGFHVTVSDGHVSYTRGFQFEVIAINHAPYWKPTNVFGGTIKTGQALDSWFGALDDDFDPTTFTATGSLPQGLSWRGVSGSGVNLMGTPAKNSGGHYVMTFTASDGEFSVDAVLTLDVVLENEKPTFTSTPAVTARGGHVYAYDLNATDADGEPLHFSSDSLPSWLTLIDHGDGTATLSGTPGAADTLANVNIAVTDGYESTSQTFAIDIAPNRAPAFTSSPPTQPVVAGTPFVYTIATADLDGDARAITASVLPAWLTLTDNGNGTATLTGVPNDVDGGVNPLGLRVSDGQAMVEQAFNIEVLVERFRLVNGVLSVTGGVENDVIDVWIRNGDQVRAVRNGVIKNYPLSSIKEVQLLGFDGNDSLSVNTRSIPAYAVGGAGNDTILGGDEPDNFVGGGGKDVLDSGGGNDRLDGSAGNDKLLGGAGDDRLIGNDGNDVLIGGDGRDQFFGGAGDDVLYSRDGFIDVLNGGDGTDSAQLDAIDLKEDLLALLQ